MKFKRQYLLNGGLLLLIAMLWNIIFYAKLPEVFLIENFTKNIPRIILTFESIFRYITFTFTFFIVIELKTRLQKAGLLIFIIGIIIYFSSWSIQMFAHESMFATSFIGFCAPAYTAIIWLLGIGLLSANKYKRMIFIPVSLIFIMLHTVHIIIVYKQYF
ncbi:MAG: hypothetical protein PQJ46_01465 [Spirochaetales bacterium]|nr:hypothetical protein [Spirochaetales bacterium]